MHNKLACQKEQILMPSSFFFFFAMKKILLKKKKMLIYVPLEFACSYQNILLFFQKHLFILDIPDIQHVTYENCILKPSSQNFVFASFDVHTDLCNIRMIAKVLKNALLLKVMEASKHA